MLGAEAIGVSGQHIIWQEGFVFEGSKLQRGGVLRDGIIMLVRAYDNVADLTAAGPPIHCNPTVICHHQAFTLVFCQRDASLCLAFCRISIIVVVV